MDNSLIPAPIGVAVWLLSPVGIIVFLALKKKFKRMTIAYLWVALFLVLSSSAGIFAEQAALKFSRESDAGQDDTNPATKQPVQPRALK